MRILDNLSLSGSFNAASSAKDTFTIGSELERDNPNADDLKVWANARFYNDVQLGSSSVDIISANGQLTASSGISASAFYGDGSHLTNVGAVQASGITVQETGNGAGSPIASVTTLKFDRDTGFHVEDVGDNAVKISLGSSFKTWNVSGNDPLVAVGEDTVEIIAGNNITISTNTSSNPKSITFNSPSSNSSQTKEYILSLGPVHLPVTGVAVETNSVDAYVAITSGTAQVKFDKNLPPVELNFPAINDIYSSGVVTIRGDGADFTNLLGPDGILPGIIIEGTKGVSISTDDTRSDSITLESRGGIRLRLDENENGQANCILLDTGPNTVTGTYANGPVNIRTNSTYNFVSTGSYLDNGQRTISITGAIADLDSALFNISNNLSSQQNSSNASIPAEYDALLLYGEGAANGTNFIDSSLLNVNLTSGGTISTQPNPDTTGTYNKFSASSIKTLASGYISAPDSAVYAIGKNPFTIEAFVYPINYGTGDGNITGIILDTRGDGNGNTDGWFLGFSGVNAGAGKLSFQFGSANIYARKICSSVVTQNAWNHIAICGYGNGIFAAFLNGNRTDVWTSTANPYYQKMTIGQDFQKNNSYAFNGYLNQIRILNGIAAYKGATYTVPTAYLS